MVVLGSLTIILRWFWEIIAGDSGRNKESGECRSLCMKATKKTPIANTDNAVHRNCVWILRDITVSTIYKKYVLGLSFVLSDD